MPLCTNRFEPFGPHSSIHPSLPTQCFLDTIVVPLPTWLYMIAIPILALALRNKSRLSPPPQHDTKFSAAATPRTRRSCGQTSLQVLYGLLVFAMVAMISLEIARLTAAQLGIGLLPFSYVGVLGAAVVHFWLTSGEGMRIGTGRVVPQRSMAGWALRFCSAAFWVLLLVAMAIKAAAAKTEENDGFVRTGTQAKYPVDDSYVDNLTMACVEGVLALLELVTL